MLLPLPISDPGSLFSTILASLWKLNHNKLTETLLILIAVISSSPLCILLILQHKQQVYWKVDATYIRQPWAELLLRSQLPTYPPISYPSFPFQFSLIPIATEGRMTLVFSLFSSLSFPNQLLHHLHTGHLLDYDSYCSFFLLHLTSLRQLWFLLHPLLLLFFLHFVLHLEVPL